MLYAKVFRSSVPHARLTRLDVSKARKLRVVRELGTQVDPRKSRVEVDGTKIVAEKLIYIVLHKPRGVTTTMRAPRMTSPTGSIAGFFAMDFALAGVPTSGEAGDGVVGRVGRAAAEVGGRAVGAGPVGDVVDRGRGGAYVGEHGAGGVRHLQLGLGREPGRDGDRGHGPTACTGVVSRSSHGSSCWVARTLSWSVRRKSYMVWARASA